MLKPNDLRTFLISNGDPANFSLLNILDSLSTYLEAHITLIDNSGSIIYSTGKTSCNTQRQTINPDLPKQNYATLTIEKKNLSQLENVLIEMTSGIISIHLHKSIFTNSKNK